MAQIRPANAADADAVRGVYLEAFSDDEKEAVADLAVGLLGSSEDSRRISLVAESAGTVVGHIAFSAVAARQDSTWRGYILSPLAVAPDCQSQGLGSRLINDGVHQIKDLAGDCVLVYGDPAYYGRFGFQVDSAARYVPPYELQYPTGWQALELTPTTHPETAIEVTVVAQLQDPDLW